MKRIYHLGTCSTNIRILKELKPGKDVELIDIKKENIDPKTLDWMKDQVGSYEALFSRKAMKYRSMGLHEKQLTEKDYRKLMLEEYTFLKRPFMICDDKVFVGNTKVAVQEAKEAFSRN